MTRHESRRPSPKVTGPSVPEANLRKSQIVRPGVTSAVEQDRQTHDRMFIFADSHTKNILMKCVSVLSSMSTGRIPIEWKANQTNRSLISVDQVVRVKIIRYAPRSSTPQSKSLSEIRRVKLAAEVVLVGVTASSNIYFSSWLMFEVRILAKIQVGVGKREPGQVGGK